MVAATSRLENSHEWQRCRTSYHSQGWSDRDASGSFSIAGLRKIHNPDAHFYNAQENKANPSHHMSKARLQFDVVQAEEYVPNDSCFRMCKVRYWLHTVAVDPTGAKFSSTDSSSSSNTPNEFSSYTFVERTLMAIGSGGIEPNGLTPGGRTHRR
jgi:hypothetical protein